MHPQLKEALDAGLVEASLLADGSPLLIDGVPYYQATEAGMRLNHLRITVLGNKLDRHDALKLTDETLKVGISTLTALLKRIRAQASLDTEQVLDAAQEALVLVDRLQQQRQIGLSVEQLYEIAAIFYFSEEEDPTTLHPDPLLHRQKINRWLKHDQAKVFYWHFLRSAVGRYMPLEGLANPDVLTLLREQGYQRLFDSTRVLAALGDGTADQLLLDRIEAQRKTNQAIDDMLASVLADMTADDNLPS